MTDILQDWMRHAAGLTQGGKLQEATAAIQAALKQGLPPGWPDGTYPTRPGSFPRGAPQGPAPTPQGDVIEGCVFEVGASPDRQAAGSPQLERFRGATHTHGAITGDYKLYQPPLASDEPRPLMVMLHGCTQDPDDFAAGTHMNALARALGFYVLYPAQSQRTNPQKCWNWFKHSHQQRDRGEPAWIASLTLEAIARHAIDPRRVYIAGLSAGGAMAALVAAAYPDVFAAAGVHSGLAPGAASNLPDALAAMKGTRMGTENAPFAGGLKPRQRGTARAVGETNLGIPTIVFHGDCDQVVHPSNGEQVLQAALRGAGGHSPLETRIERGQAENGRSYTRSIHTDLLGKSVVESWVLHGAGHAWAGGQPAGSYTDPTGPDASREMLRFFAQHRRPV